MGGRGGWVVAVDGWSRWAGGRGGWIVTVDE